MRREEKYGKKRNNCSDGKAKLFPIKKTAISKEKLSGNEGQKFSYSTNTMTTKKNSSCSSALKRNNYCYLAMQFLKVRDNIG